MRSSERLSSRPTRTMLGVGVVVGLALVAAGCGSDADSSSDSVATSDATSTTDPPATDVSAVTTQPVSTAAGTDDVDGAQRIVSLSPTHTEILFAIGAGDQLVAVDEYSDYPAEALDVPHDLSGYEPSVEAIAGYDPDLVITGGDFTGLGDQLAEIDIESWDGPAALALQDTYDQIEQLGAITGHVAEAAELVEQMQTDIDQIVADTPLFEVPLTVYHELDSSFFSADSTTFIGELYGMLGLRNIADQAEGDSGGYPQLNAEFIVSADPDLIFLADTLCCGETLDTVSARPGWDAITAVQNGAIFEMDDNIASRWGPRVVDYLEAVSAAIQQTAVPA